MKILFKKYWDRDCWQVRLPTSISIFSTSDSKCIIFEILICEIQIWFGKKEILNSIC